MSHRKSIPSYRRKLFAGREIAIVTLSDAWTRRRRDVWLGRFGEPKSREKYLRVIAEWEARGRRLAERTPGLPQFLSIAELCLAYRQAARPIYSASELASVDKVIRLMLDLYGTTPAALFGPNSLRTIRQTMIDGRPSAVSHQPSAGTTEHWLRRPWSRSHINRQVHRLRRLFRWAASHELLPISVYEALRTVEPLRRGRTTAAESPPVTCAPVAAVDATKCCASRHIAAMIDLQVLTGMRPGELCALRPCDIDMSGPVWLYRPSSHKGAWQGRERVIYLGPRAQQVLRPFLSRRIDVWCFSPAEAEDERRAELYARRTTPLGEGNRPGSNRREDPQRRPGDRYTTLSYGLAVRRACDRADREAKTRAATAGVVIAAGSRLLPRWHPHQLRHNFATAVRREFGLEAAAILCGHASATITDAVYAERDAGKAAAIAERVG